MALEVGVSLPVFLDRHGSAQPDIAGAARHAEDIGLDAAWSGDHLSTGAPFVDSTVALTAAATATERIRLGYGVMLIALRHPAWTAKQVGSLQLLSGNRLRLGVGVGGQWPDEWAAAGVPTAARGRRTDAIVALLPGLLAGEPTRLATEPGEPEVTLAPGVPMPPLWVGGMSEVALRRAVRIGAEGWLGSMVPPSVIPGVAGRLAGLAEEAEAEAAVPALGMIVFSELVPRGGTGRDAAVRYLTRSYGMPEDYARQVSVSGPPELLAERITGYAEAGVSHFVIATVGAGVRDQYDLVAEARAALDGVRPTGPGRV
ncbi:MAG TPA: LLM class flavin-dependent oxidoreductase [Actinophytocola sp.]|uniref:LLM class flavin-dependent oxidoreductase n=1 Tax=Actinophytocola sp. TaxID=1872138 RepID=UPI002DB8589D|nr:LLM class flavin-dependent oxidoreductase [Actinophytocola sp.]HEU5474836.1 LLM class flavin-dependent oxidoreductase [Actinophytocola sp.]